jgi:hypothetical protein
MDFVSKIVSGNIDRIKRNISNSFVQDLDVEKGFDDELEKGKWNVGDQRFYHGTMHYVAELKPDGSPRWKRVKKTSGGGNDTSSSTKTSDDNKQSSTNNQSSDSNQNSTKQSNDSKNSSVKSNKELVNKVLDQFEDNPLFSKEKIEKLILDHIPESKEFLQFKFPAAGSAKTFSKNVDEKEYNLNGSILTFRVDRNRGYRINTKLKIFLGNELISYAHHTTDSEQSMSLAEAKKSCLYFGLAKYLSKKHKIDIRK